MAKFAATCRGGVFLAVKGKTGALIVGMSGGVRKTRTEQRKPFEDSGRSENAGLVKAWSYTKEGRDRKGKQGVAPRKDGRRS